MSSSVRIEVTPTLLGSDSWVFTMTCPETEWSVSHTVAGFTEEPHYPRPQLSCGEDCDHLLCSGSDADRLGRTLSDLGRREIRGEIADRLGRYLFDTLLGPHWKRMADYASQLDRDVVELALTWPYSNNGDPASSAGAALAQLPWELMRDEHNHNLAATGDGVLIAVTRVVAGTDHTAQPFSVPPKVLFVVGATLTDQSVRAGAEMLALLREVRDAGCRIRYRILENATPKRLYAAMSTFSPDIVHFISHGSLDEQGRGRLQLRSDDKKSEAWPAERVLQSLRVEGRLPTVVVLSACDGAGDLNVIAGPQIAAPLATELVHGGVPVVVAMSGRVTDRACRVFTRYFGRALAVGESLVEATALARQRAFAEIPGGADWALPTVFFSAGVDGNEVRHSPDPAAVYLDNLADNASWSQVPVFCARESFLQAFWSMLDDEQSTAWHEHPGRRPSVLAVCAQDGHSGIGKTRLLEELAREALLNGHLPLVIGSSSDDPPPGDVRGLARSLAREMRLLGKKILEIESDLGDELRAFARRDPTQALDPDDEFFSPDEVTELANRLEADSDELRSAAIEKYRDHGNLFTDASRVILLIDELGEASEPLLMKLFAKRHGLNKHGLGSSRHPVPVVLVALTDGKDNIRSNLLSGSISETWLRSLELQEFANDGEDMLAYELVLLNPWRSGGDEQLKQRWIFSRDPDASSKPTDHARKSLKGMPVNFINDRYEMFVTLGALHKMLIDADDGDTPLEAVR